MAKVVALIWDMDGTLVDSSEIVPAAFIACLAAARGPTVTRKDVIDAYAAGPPAAIVSRLLGRSPPAHEMEVFYDQLSQSAAVDLHAFAGIPKVLESLTTRTRLAVFTGGSRRAARILLEAAHLDQFFDQVVGGDEVSRPKPNPDGLFEVCSRLAISPSEAAYIGDSPLDLQAARSAGVAAVAAGWGHLFQEASRTLADVTLSEPAQAAALI